MTVAGEFDAMVPAGQAGTLQIRSHNAGNQLTQLGGTGKAMVQGTVDEAATVTVNGDPAAVIKLGSSGPWEFQRELSFSSGTTNIEVEATDGNSNVTTKNYTINVSGTADKTLEYDANGNLLLHKDGAGTVLRQFTWDAENRLLTFQSAATPASGVKRTEFTYDGMGRRVTHIEKEHDGTTWITQFTWTYIWDGLALLKTFPGMVWPNDGWRRRGL